MTTTLLARRLKEPLLSKLLDKALSRPTASEDVVLTEELMRALFQDALRERASDIHIDPTPERYWVRFRIDGAMVDTIQLSPAEGQRLIRAIKSRAGLDPTFSRTPKDGRFDVELGDNATSARIATAPTVMGEKLAVRFLPEKQGRLRLDELGLSPRDRDQLIRAIQDANGMVLISGPTGCGKTTTAYALLRELIDTHRSVVTIEAPVEHLLEGITQMQVNERQGLTFDRGVAGLLRLDPDVIMMGEIREEQSAHAALTAADSGHLFLSTLHARDAAGTITALRNFGLADHAIAANLSMIVAQRLVRRLCASCSKKEGLSQAERARFERYHCPVPASTWHPVGCARCSGTGYCGRVGIFEVWSLRETDAELLLEHAAEPPIRKHLRESGTLSLVQDAIEKLEQGVTSLSEMPAIAGLGFFSPSDHVLLPK